MLIVDVAALVSVAMGKKNKKAKSVSAESDSGMPRHVRREVLEMVNQLLESTYQACLAVACSSCCIFLTRKPEILSVT